MSSTPARGSPGGEADTMASTPPSSPPSRAGEDGDFDPRAERMAEEEKRLRQQAKLEEAEEKKRSLEWVKANKGEQKGQFNKLMHLVEQSKVFAAVMQKRMQQEETSHQAKDESQRKKLEKQEAQREQAAVNSQRKATRQSKASQPEPSTLTSSPSKKLPTRGRGRPPKRENGKISDWLKKEDVSGKAGDMTVAEAIAEAADDPGAQAGNFGARNLRSDNQPKEVTGGIMRSYQLEGLYWLRSLYENGLNGILADEMGLGKTIQTISFLAFLREMKSFGPFLIVAPLSTLSNWIDEFARWTPTINTVLYHGSPADRAQIRTKKLRKPGTESFPIVCTSYEICMNDRKFLSQYGWKFIIIDEGHRLKNLNCRLIKELKQYQSANRLLITGTPLQNNLAELWSLLNFLMPEVFDTLENFESFFDFSAVLSKGGHKEIIKKEEQNNLIASLHAILKPFLLRRVKTDVETDLPPKREYILYAPLSAPQKELYRHILEGTSRSYLEDQAIDSMLANNHKLKGKGSAASLKRKFAADSESTTPNKSAKSSRASTPASTRGSRKGPTKRATYAEVSDRQFFRDLEHQSTSAPESESEEEDEEERELARTIQLAKREIASKKLQNPIMQLRLACNSPHNFYWPFADDPNDFLVRDSGKMLLLERLVPHLFARGHKILIFSQFKTQLDILEEWASSLHDWPVCRVDGGVSHTDRKEQIHDFNTRDDVQLFLLSTRAGGQGINLATADTVILFDSDWNPQQDLQAQDRAHRIGQTRPVIVYRLATRGTVEQTLLEKADGKRRLEKLVIRKGKFRSLGDAGQDDLNELARLLEADDGEQLDVQGEGEKLLSDGDLEILTDRSEEAYARAARGEEMGEMFKAVETHKDVGVLADMSGG